MKDFTELLQGGIGVIIVILLIILVSVIATIIKCFRKVRPGTALVRSGWGKMEVGFTGMILIPVLHRAESLDISVKRIEIELSGANGLICKDNIRADIKMAFFVQVIPTDADVKNIAKSIGCERASNQAELQNLFEAKFSEALKAAGKRYDFISLFEDRCGFRESVIELIGTDLNGFQLEDAAIDLLEQTPLEMLDPKNILDSEGIKKITELTAAQATLANEIQREKERSIKMQDVEAKAALLDIELQHEQAVAKQIEEIERLRNQSESKMPALTAQK